MSRIRRINVPDYDESKAINIKSGLNAANEWTAPANGYAVLLPLDENYTWPIPVAKGSVIKIEIPSNLKSAKFYPCK